MTSLLLRGIAIWTVILGIAILNGAFRQGVLVPRLGDATAHVWSTVALASAVVLVTYLTIGWIGPVSAGDCWMIGGLWLLLTVGFEFLAGHFLFGVPWAVLVADYKVNEGRIWPLVLVVTLLAPTVSARLRGL